MHHSPPGKNAGVGCHAHLQGIFLTQGLNLSLKSPKLTGGLVTTSASWESPLVSPEKTEIPGGQIEQLLSGDTQEFKTRLAWFLIFPGYHRDS